MHLLVGIETVGTWEVQLFQTKKERSLEAPYTYMFNSTKMDRNSKFQSQKWGYEAKLVD